MYYNSDEVITMLLSVWLSDWIALRAPELKPRTIESYKDLCRLHINPALGQWELHELTPEAITHMLAGISAEGHSRTCEMCYVLLRSALKDCEPDPMRRVRRPAHLQVSPEAWSDADCATYLRALVGHRHQLPLSLALLLGLRRGEICGLRWQDVDFQRGLIHIVNQRQRLASGEIVDLTPKSRTSVRTLPIPGQLLPLLRRCRQLSGYLCSISPSGLDAAHRAIVRRLGLPYIPLHGLRHSMATACIRHGGDMRSLQAVLGHASYATTANRYTHPDVDMLRSTIDLANVSCYNVLQ